MAKEKSQRTTETRCNVCQHPERAKIELALARKVGAPQLAKRYSMTTASLYRHRDRHMPPQLKAALQTAMQPSDIDLEALRKSESEGLLQHLVAQRGRLYRAQDEALELGDLNAVSRFEGRMTDNIQLTAKLLGEITSHAQTTVNTLIVSPEYTELRSALLRALHPYPEARKAVAQVLRQIEDGEQPQPQTIDHQPQLNGHGGGHA